MNSCVINVFFIQETKVRLERREIRERWGRMDLQDFQVFQMMEELNPKVTLQSCICFSLTKLMIRNSLNLIFFFWPNAYPSSMNTFVLGM